MVTFFSKHSKVIATLFLSVFYMELVAQVSISKMPGHGFIVPSSPGPGNPVIIPFDKGTIHNNIEPAEPLKKNAEPEIITSSDPVPERIGEKIHAEGKKTAKVDIDGPSQPEMQGFRPVGADNMVDLFTGDFSYSIPLLDVGGYPVNLSYSANVTMEQESSWVGLGWNINPGTISRNMRGLPDDFNGTEEITKKMNLRPNTTTGISVGGALELAGLPLGPLNIGLGIYKNNYTGYGMELSASTTLGVVTKNDDPKTPGFDSSSLSFDLGLNLDSKKGLNLRPSLEMQQFKVDRETQKGTMSSSGIGFSYDSRSGFQSIELSGSQTKISTKQETQSRWMQFNRRWQTTLSFGFPSFMPSIRMPTVNKSFSFNAKAGGESFFFLGSPWIKGYYNKTVLAEKVVKHRAYGYMHFQNVKDDKKALMDFNRLNDGLISKNTLAISFPNYTYDVFSVSGEGTGGSFRAYRGEVGYVKDPETNTQSGSFAGGADFGSGPAAAKVGVNISLAYSPLRAGEWEESNLARKVLGFRESNGTYEGVYFRNPAEKAIVSEEFQNAVGNDDLVRFKFFAPTGSPSMQINPIIIPQLQGFNPNKSLKNPSLPIFNEQNVKKNKRDKRSQVMSFLSAEEAAEIGLERRIRSYEPGQVLFDDCGTLRYKGIHRVDQNRRPHHISEVTVLNTDGMRHIYGVPVYNLEQTDVTFNVENRNPDETVTYTSEDASPQNTKGKDRFFQSERMPAYAHSYLLTGVLSPDYVDVKGDGITDDDKGNAVKFNYSLITSDHQWRIPYLPTPDKAALSEGLQTEIKDNKGNYSFGKKELWYMHSIESKNLMAVFYVSPRNDMSSRMDEHGNKIPNVDKMKLDRIDLYIKSDLKKNINAKPVKSVHFEYNYELCNGVVTEYTGTDELMKGKLTLKSVSFSYKGRFAKKKNVYRFDYHNNKPYNRTASDRWGNYKNPAHNPGGLSNANFPYALQNPAHVQQGVAPWALNKIILPSGGKIEVEYESDDYAYIQNRKATVMCNFEGFAGEINHQPTNSLYSQGTPQNSGRDFEYIFFRSDIPGITEKQIREIYLRDMTQLALRMAVKVPAASATGPQHEFVSVFAQIETCGPAPYNAGFNQDNNLFWIKVHTVEDGYSPFAQTAIRFLQEMMPGRAFAAYDTEEQPFSIALLTSLVGMVSSITTAFTFPDKSLRNKGYCKQVDLSKSFARMVAPNFKKYGGGYRVKKVKIYDSWDKMKQKPESIYGQVYEYETKELVSNQWKTISSGVANYEPGIGSEENPFREILRYTTSQFLTPTEAGTVELPLGEAFYPSPNVGYSKVTVRPLHENVKNSAGIQVTEFFTAKEFPLQSDFTNFDHLSRVRRVPDPILQILNIDKQHDLTLSQGLRVVLNDMHGKLKSQATYGIADPNVPIAFTRNYYKVKSINGETFKLENTVPAATGPSGVVKNSIIGRDIELMTDFREHFAKTYSLGLDFNIDFQQMVIAPVFAFSLVPPFTYSHNRYRGASVVKVVNQYGILDSVVVIDKGSKVSTSNELYDGETGNVILTKTKNGFGDPVYNFNYPAHWSYTGMDAAYKNIDVKFSNITFKDGIITSGMTTSQMNEIFESGDELFITDLKKRTLISFQVETEVCLEANSPVLVPNTFPSKVWALNTSKDPQNAGSWLFIDKDGRPFSHPNVSFRIVRSGKRNMHHASVGSIVSKQEPLNQQKTLLVLNNNTDVINASTATYKDHWKVDDSYELKDTIITTKNQATLYQVPINANATQMVRNYQRRINNGLVLNNYMVSSNTGLFLTRNRSITAGNFPRISSQWSAESWMRFDLSSLPSTAIIHKAELSLHTGLNQSLPSSSYHDAINLTQDEWHVNSNNNGTANGNAFKIERMKTQWFPQTNIENWKSVFNNAGSVDGSPGGYKIFPLGVAPLQQGTSSYEEKYIDVTEMVHRMNRDRNIYAPGIRISLIKKDPGSGEARTAFTPLSNKGFVPLWVQFYTCDSTSMVNYPNAYPSYSSDTVYCTTSQQETWCVSRFTKRRINPYVEGMLGNWRADTVFTYYGERRESTAGTQTNIRTDGLISNFLPFWQFATPLLNKTLALPWQWVSVSTQFNQRGLEIENKDPLGRFNSGIYGYGKNLPVAVINNSRYRESMFDGFEDYDFQYPSACASCPVPVHHRFEDGWISAYRSTEEAHTGKYSVKLTSGQSIKMKTIINDDTSSWYRFRVKMDQTQVNMVTVTPAGGSITQERYDNHSANTPSSTTQVTGSQGLMKFSFTGISNVGKKFRWRGKLQAPITGGYVFYTAHDDGASISLNNQVIYPETPHSPSLHPVNQTPIQLQKGEVYDLVIELKNNQGPAGFILQWGVPFLLELQTIPMKYVYPLNSTAYIGTKSAPFVDYCIKPDTIQTWSNGIVDTFSMVSGRKMVFSAWVKEGAQDCKCSTYVNNSVEVKFLGQAGNVTTTLYPKGSIIEGWQRYEGVFQVPATAYTNIEFSLKNTGSQKPVYFDDIRIHPYNSNMKSFVFHPNDLRLMAELDENNYAAFYEYDDDGTLIRTKKETSKGIKTITESRSATQKVVTTW